MARKGLLSKSLDRTLSGDTAKPDAIERSAPSPAPEAVKARSGNPTVKRFKETFDELRGEAMQEIDTALIGSSRYKDRFDASSDIQGLAASIQEAGQQIPVLLRVTKPGSEYEYEPVYGRRRISACHQLGIKVKAYITDLDDEQVIVAQGLENSERLENSFIEKAYFIEQLSQGGFTGSFISQAIGIQGSEISRMISIVRNAPEELVTSIGPAHGVGRRQWSALVAAAGVSAPEQLSGAIKAIEAIQESPDRFTRALAYLTTAKPREATAGGAEVVANGKLTITKGAKAVSIKVSDKADKGFIDWVMTHSEDLYDQWKAQAENG